MSFAIAVKIIITLFLLAWTAIGFYLCLNFKRFFGVDKEHPSETPGERSFGITHVFAVWIGGMALGIYYLCG